MEPGPPGADSAAIPEEPNTESFLAALLVDDADVTVDSITGKASVSKRKARAGDSGGGEDSQKVRP
ncbi:MAG: hypothetical protein E6J20_09085 [Chloroflexi bacterium]|nr:MAG: hypothetical protein E6J20_09085 [Chloroflexota bacterium]